MIDGKNTTNGTLTVELNATVGEGDSVSADAVMLASGWTFTAPEGSLGTTLKYKQASGNQSSDTFTLTDKYGTQEVFNIQGDMIQEFDRNQNQTQFTWNTAGSSGTDTTLASIETQGGQTWNYTYGNSDSLGDADTTLSQITDFTNSRETDYTISGGQVTQVTWPDPNSDSDVQPVMSFEYAGPDNRLSSVSQNSASGPETTAINYDSVTGRVSSVKNPDGKTWSLTPFLADGIVDAGDGLIRKPTGTDAAIGDQDDSPSGDTFVEPRATYTDPDGNDWVYQVDAYGYVLAGGRARHVSRPQAGRSGSGRETKTGWWTRISSRPTSSGYDGSLDQLTTSYSYDTNGNCTEAVYLLPGEDPKYPNGISES